jgi:hypothetical protein
MRVTKDTAQSLQVHALIVNDQELPAGCGDLRNVLSSVPLQAPKMMIADKDTELMNRNNNTRTVRLV